MLAAAAAAAASLFAEDGMDGCGAEVGERELSRGQGQSQIVARRTEAIKSVGKREGAESYAATTSTSKRRATWA